MRIAVALLTSLLLIAGCREEKTGAASPASANTATASSARQQAAREAATAALRERMRGQETQLRGVQVFSQALSNTVAVCGRSSVRSGEPYIPYVAVVSFEGEAARVTGFTLGATGPEASRVFLEMVDRCFEGGGPLSSRPMARSYPPLPAAGAADPAEARSPAAPAPQMVSAVSTSPSPAPAPDAAPAVQASSMPASRSTVVTWSRAGANLRSGPAGGEVIGVIPPMSTLDVVGEAPGGWYRVGRGGTPLGWVHASVLEPGAR